MAKEPLKFPSSDEKAIKELEKSYSLNRDEVIRLVLLDINFTQANKACKKSIRLNSKKLGRLNSLNHREYRELDALPDDKPVPKAIRQKAEAHLTYCNKQIDEISRDLTANRRNVKKAGHEYHHFIVAKGLIKPKK